MGMGGNWDENQFPHTSSIDLHIIWKVRPRNALTDCWCICRGHTAFDWNVLMVSTIVNAPTGVIAVFQCVFRARTAEVIQPNWIHSRTVCVAYFLTGSSVSWTYCAYRVGQIKWHHFTFLLITHECIHKILWFLAHMNDIMQKMRWLMFSLCHYVNSYSPEGATNMSTFYLH